MHLHPLSLTAPPQFGQKHPRKDNSETALWSDEIQGARSALGHPVIRESNGDLVELIPYEESVEQAVARRLSNTRKQWEEAAAQAKAEENREFAIKAASTAYEAGRRRTLSSGENPFHTGQSHMSLLQKPAEKNDALKNTH